jgi:hypothetical protein
MDDNNRSIIIQEVICLPPVPSTLEIGCLYGDSNGCCCAKHDKCSLHLEVGDICRLVWKLEDAIALMKLVDGQKRAQLILFLVQY